MQLEEYFSFLGPNDIRLKGHRIGIETILFDYLELGMSAEEIGLRYPSLSLEEIHATLAYYWRKQPEIDTYLKAAREHEVRKIQEQGQNGSPAVIRLYNLLKEQRRRESDQIL